MASELELQYEEKPFMKKSTVLICMIVLLFVLSACGGSDETSYVPPVTNQSDTFLFPFEFTAEDLYGNQLTAESLGEMEIFFVYFWTTWCPACVQGMPGLAELAEEFGDRVGFISLLGDFATARDAAINIVNNAGVSFPTLDAEHSDFQPVMELMR